MHKVSKFESNAITLTSISGKKKIFFGSIWPEHNQRVKHTIIPLLNSKPLYMGPYTSSSLYSRFCKCRSRKTYKHITGIPLCVIRTADELHSICEAQLCGCPMQCFSQIDKKHVLLFLTVEEIWGLPFEYTLWANHGAKTVIWRKLIYV